MQLLSIEKCKKLLKKHFIKICREILDAFNNLTMFLIQKNKVAIKQKLSGKIEIFNLFEKETGELTEKKILWHF